MKFPKKFVSLHNHTTFSPHDGLGYPNEHFEFAKSNGLDAHAITEHGNFNSYAHSQLFVEEWKKKGIDFKYLPGIEAYFHPDLTEWQREKDAHNIAKQNKKDAKKLNEKHFKDVQTIITPISDSDDETLSVEMTNALTIENEEESKTLKHFNPLNRRHHLVLLPKNEEGLQQLFHLTSMSFIKGYYRFPRVDVKMIKEIVKKGNVVAQSACIAGLPAFNIFRELQKYKFDELTPSLLDDSTVLDKCVIAVGNAYEMMVDTFGKENYFLELQFNKLPAQDVVNRAIIEFAKRNGVTGQLTSAADSHYYNPDVWKERELYKKLGFMNYKEYSADSLPKSKDELKCELYPKNATQMWDEYLSAKDRYSFYDESHDEIICDAIERSHDIAHNIIGNIKPDRSVKLPKKLVPIGQTPIQYLTRLCIEGLKKHGFDKNKVYVERLKEELGIIKDLNVAEYFITLAKILDLARDVTLLGPARGSGGGSLVNYVLYITDLDPIRWDLPFARFMSRYRVGLPDIDCDLGDRDKVLDVMREEFGYNNVVPISNYNTTKIKSLTKDVSKFYGIPFEEVNAATMTVEQDVRKATQKQGDDKNLFVLTYTEAMKYSKSYSSFIEKHPEVGESIVVLFKQNRSLGRHAGGVLVCDDLETKMPLITSKGEPQSPWVEGVQWKHLEKIGNFVKYDLLGLETLRLIERTISLILKQEGIENPSFADVRKWFDEHMKVDKIDLLDQDTFKVYSDGKWCGIFQGSSFGAQRFFEKAKPKSIIDIAVLTSIYRPGPLAAHLDKLWLKALEGEEYDWGDKRINEILAPTRGLLIFQEGVMELAEKVAGFPKEKCDEVRRAIMKRSISGGDAAKAKVDEMKSSFVEGAMQNGYTKSVAENVYEKISFFSGYGFNKSHAVAYAVDSYYCAWLLTHYEQLWLCAYLESMSHNPDDRTRAFSEVKAMGYEIVPIDVNYATNSWTILPGKKFMPSMSSCKGLGLAAIEEIVEYRPYKSIEHMLWNTDGSWKPSKFNRRALEALIKIGGLGSLDAIGEGKPFSSYAHMYHILIENSDLIKKSPKKDPHFGLKIFYELARRTRDEVKEWTQVESVLNQVEILGSVDVNRLVPHEIAVNLHKKGIRPIDQLEEGEKDIAWLICQSIKPKKTKLGKMYGQMEALGPSGKIIKVSVWGWKGEPIKQFGTFIAEIERNSFGCSTVAWKLKGLNV